MAEIILINPRFEVSYWGLEHALPLIGKRANMPVACLPLLAALTPPGHSVTLVDENMEDIDFDRCARADIVGLTGMVVQRGRMLEILAELKRRGAFVVVGGAWVTVKEDDFDGLGRRGLHRRGRARRGPGFSTNGSGVNTGIATSRTNGPTWRRSRHPDSTC